MDFGVFWKEGSDRINLYSLHVINDTCEVYIDTYDGHVELLGALPTTPEKAYSVAEVVFAGWTEAITNDDSLNWVRQRLAVVL